MKGLLRIARWRRLIRSVASASFVAFWLTSCQGEVPPEAIEVSILDHGLFEVRSGQLVRVDETTRIPCSIGAIFGVDYRIEVAGLRPGRVPVDFRWRHPELAVPSKRLWGTETAASASNPRIGLRNRTLQGRALWHLEHPDELVSGHFEFVIERVVDGETLARQGFDVEGC